jgi:pentatricopeptide repeat protein
MADAKPAAGMPLPDAMAGNFQDAVRWFNQMWSAGIDPGAAGRAAAGAVPSMMMPTLDIKEIDKRIADLRSVEQWLQLNQGLLRTTIQTLELQRAGLAAWQDLGAAAGRMTPSGTSAAATDAAGRPQASAAMGAAAGAAAGAAEAAAFQPALWWAALQQQFAQMASGALAATPATEASAGAVAPAGASTPATDAPQAAAADAQAPADSAPGKAAGGKGKGGGAGRV